MNVDESISLIEVELLKTIRDMFAKGMTVAAIAGALALPVAVVTNVVKAPPAASASALKLAPVRTGDAHITADERVVDDLARTLFAEARGEGERGLRAVASVIYNRAKGNVNKMVAVVKAPWQFSPWNNGRTPPRGQGRVWELCTTIAKEMAAGEFQPTTAHTHYYNPTKAQPSWAYEKGAHREYTQIGRHRFLTVETIALS